MILGLVLLTGCWDQRAIEQRAIVEAMGISSDHRWTFLFPNVTVTTSSISSLGQTDQFYGLTVRAHSYQEAFHRVQLQADRQVSIGDLQVIDVSSKVTGSALARIIDAMILTGSVPAQVWLVASSLSPSVLLKHSSPQTVVPVYYLSSYFDCHACHAADLGVRAWRWWDRSVTPGVSPVLPLFFETKEGVGVDRLLVYPPHGVPLIMPREATRGYAYLMGLVKNGTQRVTWHGETYAVSPIIDSARSHLELTPTAVRVQIVLHAKGEMADLPAGAFATRAMEQGIDRAAATSLVQLGRIAIQWANQNHVDPFGYAKRAAWLNPAVGQELSPQTLAALPIHAVICARVSVQGEGLSR